MSVKDHFGNEYDSQEAMCEAYGVKIGTFRARRASGWSLKDALSPLKIVPRAKVTIDHLGKCYNSEDEMAKAYGIEPSFFHARLIQGMSVKDALTKPKQERGTTVDHKGKEYPSFKAMCIAYDKDITIVKRRLSKGISLKEALESPSRKGIVTDHLGNTFTTKKDMCEHYGVDRNTYNNRIRNGWSQKDALEATTKFNGRGVYKVAERQNEQKEMGNGLVAKVVEYQNRHNIVVEFVDDGARVHASYKDYITGTIGHPTLNPRGRKKGTYCGFDVRRIDGKWFDCKCRKCGLKDIMTPRQMMEHRKKCQQDI